MAIRNRLRFYCKKHNCGLLPMVGKKSMYYRCRYWDYRYRPVGLKACTFCLSIDEMDRISAWLEQTGEENLQVGLKYAEDGRYAWLQAEISKITPDLLAVCVEKEKKK